MQKIFFCLILIVGLGFYKSNGQTLINSVFDHQIEFITSDELGNFYAIGKDRSIKKFDKNGDSLQEYRVIKNGKINILDVSNTLDVFILQSKFNRLTILDRMFSPMLELDLNKIGIYNSTSIGQSRDGNFWIFDNINQKLLRYDRNLNQLLMSNDLRLAEGNTITPTFLVEKNDQVILTDSLRGIYIFDRFGTLIQQLEILGIQSFQMIDNQIVFLQNGKILSYDLIQKELKNSNIYTSTLSTAKQIRIERERLYLLHSDRIEIYQIEL